MNDLSTFISNVGFPIAAFCLLWHTCHTTLKENTAAINKCATLIEQMVEQAKEQLHAIHSD